MLFILKYIRLFRSLSGPAHIVIVLPTLLFPLAFDFLVGINDFRWCWHWSCFEWTRIFVHFVMWLVSVAVIAKADKADWFRMEKNLHAMSSELNESIRLLSEDHERMITENRRAVRHLDERVSRMHQDLVEEGIDLSPPVVFGYADSISATGSLSSAKVSVSPSSRKTGRICSWCIRQARHFWTWFKKWILAKDAQ